MKLIKIILFILISFNTSFKVISANDLQSILKEEGKLIFIRHAHAPGSGDPVNFNILSCSTQRNLDKKGINVSKKIGKFFKKNNIKIDIVLSSEWCRCKDTAFHAFRNYDTKFFLNSFYDKKFRNNKKIQITNLKKYIEEWGGKKNLVLVTHYVVISEILNYDAVSGEIIITDKNFNIKSTHIIQ
ncbi:histidine phosphatase family protein [Candidatus Pelagibacter sp.]|nr:histidine phosphatase family protein [Candidatus Pelagibacter sp.]